METVLYMTYAKAPFGPRFFADELAKRLPPGKYNFAYLPPEATPAEEAAALAAAHYVAGFPRLRGERMDVARNVKLFQLMSAGFDYFDTARAHDLGIPVANNGGANAWAVAEQTLLLILASLRKFPRAIENAKSGSWRGDLNTRNLFGLAEKTVGLIGFGNIGQRTAISLLGFDAKVVYHDIRRNEEMERQYGIRHLPLDALLEQSDIVSVHAPLNASTRGLIGARQLGLMKPTAFIVSTARGGIIDEAALHDAIVAGRVAGAGLDVLDEEPARADHPLFALPQVIITPHMGGIVLDSWILRCRSTVENIERVAAGEPPLWPVN